MSRRLQTALDRARKLACDNLLFCRSALSTRVLARLTRQDMEIQSAALQTPFKTSLPSFHCFGQISTPANREQQITNHKLVIAAPSGCLKGKANIYPPSKQNINQISALEFLHFTRPMDAYKCSKFVDVPLNTGLVHVPAECEFQSVCAQ
jgi:hypothetical protein